MMSTLRKLIAPAALLVLLGWNAPAIAGIVTVTTNSTIESQPSYTFGDWIFELVSPANLGFNLIDFNPDFIVSNICCGGDFTLRRLDNAAFSLLSLQHAGEGNATVGGVGFSSPGSVNFQTFNFASEV